MLIKTNTNFKIEDYFQKSNEILLITNKTPDFNILKDSKTLEVVPNVRTAKVIKIAPKESDFLYIRNRAVSAGNVLEKDDGYAELIPMDDFYDNFDKLATLIRGANDNGDFFSHEELSKKYKTFIGKAAFVDHDNENVEKARGIILDAIYNEKGKFVELLKAVDKKAYPELARGIELGYITDTSMGCRCGYSLCSICRNKAVMEDDFCNCIRSYKGLKLNGYPVFEDNRDIEFFEDSFVTTGADKKAKILEKVARLNRLNDKETMLKKIIDEQNQRSSEGRIRTFKDQLNNLPWS